MTVRYCVCKHAQQIHTSTVSALCRGRCITHDLTDHTGRCTANRCRCDHFTEKKQ